MPDHEPEPLADVVDVGLIRVLAVCDHRAVLENAERFEITRPRVGTELHAPPIGVGFDLQRECAVGVANETGADSSGSKPWTSRFRSNDSLETVAPPWLAADIDDCSTDGDKRLGGCVTNVARESLYCMLIVSRTSKNPENGK